MKRFVAGADRGQHCLPDVACGGHGDQIETADTAVRRIEVKKPLPFAIRRRPTCSASSRERSTHRFGFSARHRGRAANF